MTTGQAWQFRPYKWSDPRQLFHHGRLFSVHVLYLLLTLDIVKGVYVTWSNDPPNPKIQDWNVMELKVPWFIYRSCDIPSHVRERLIPTGDM
jgi:parafibromin